MENISHFYIFFLNLQELTVHSPFTSRHMNQSEPIKMPQTERYLSFVHQGNHKTPQLTCFFKFSQLLKIPNAETNLASKAEFSATTLFHPDLKVPF